MKISKDVRDIILFFVISFMVIASLFFSFVLVENEKFLPEAKNDIEVAYIGEETTEILTSVESSESSTEQTTETVSESTTIIQIDDTPGFIEVPNLVPVGEVESEEIQSVEIATEATTEKPLSDNVCSISINFSTVFKNADKIEKYKLDSLPSDGVILKPYTCEIKEGDTVFSILERVLVLEEIQYEYNKTTNVYIEGINNLYEFDCGELSGWMYKVNGEFLNVACDAYKVQKGDVIEWVYTCDLGKDVGNEYRG